MAVMELIMEPLATMENFDEHAYLAANPDVAEAVKRGEAESGRKHFEVYGHKEGRRQRTSALDLFAGLKRKKLARVQPLLRKDMPYIFDNNCLDFMTPQFRAQFAIIDTDAVASNGYDANAGDLIEKHSSGLILDC